jgi:hypothetical protein
MPIIEIRERTVTETKDGWSVELLFADDPDFEVAKNAISIRAVMDVSDQYPLFRAVLLKALLNARNIIDREIQALRDEQPLTP